MEKILDFTETQTPIPTHELNKKTGQNIEGKYTHIQYIQCWDGINELLTIHTRNSRKPTIEADEVIWEWVS
jgi:hypothetical protein